jgi:acetamidase/formamidase
MAAAYVLPTDDVHYKWDVDNEPVMRIESGDTVVVETRGPRGARDQRLCRAAAGVGSEDRSGDSATRESNA